MRDPTTSPRARTIPFARPWITDEDRQAALRVLEGHVLTHGPQGQAFETEFAAFLGDGARCLTTSSCMAALHLAYLHFGIGQGDEVIVPAQTHTATAHAVEWVGATPVFVDCDARTGNVSAEAVAAAVTPRTRAVSVVHFLGIACDMPGIVAVAERHGLKVIEDCALAVGARVGGRHVGLFGDVGCFSFYPTKHITTAEGGMLVTRQPDVARGIAALRAFGVDRTHAERRVPGVYDVPTLGLNYRMSEIQAALGRTQLGRIEENLRRRRANFLTLKRGLDAFSGVRVLDTAAADPEQNSHYCLSVMLEGRLGGQRDELVAGLNHTGIGTSVYYPHPVPRLAYYRKRYGYQADRFPSAEAISDASVALPVGPHVDGEDMGYIVATIADLIQDARAR